ncbi:MAG TPA: C39 family peptidase [Chlamydiales bacterium]|nr:C39 family peptidase [Chlamydiales bacterium]
MKKILLLCSLFSSLFAQFSQAFHYTLDSQPEATWQEESTMPFDELILSWNAIRPSSGRFGFLVSLRQNDAWSPWLYYAEWGAPGQILFRENPPTSFAETRFGVAGPLKENGKTKNLCTGFRVKVLTSGGASLHALKSVGVSIARLSEFKIAPVGDLSRVLFENVPRQSQIMLRHPRYTDLSMPTAMTVALNYLRGNRDIDGSDFAESVCDDDNLGYEDWVFNAAEGYNRIQREALVTRLPDFAALHASLLRGLPVLIGMKGSVTGGPRPFYREHTLCVIGYDPDQRKVHCIDTAFPNDRSTAVAYPLDDFLRVWATQRNIACIFLEN